MVLEENWAVSEARVRAFFREQPDGLEQPAGFAFDGCTVTLSAREDTGGPFAVARTVLRFEGEEAAVRTVHRRFFLRFLSAGG